MSHSYTRLTTIFTRLHHLKHLVAMAGWDQNTMMPSKGNEARAAAIAELSVLIHQQLTSEEVASLLLQTDAQTLDTPQQANLAEMQREHRNAALLPADLVAARSLATSRCEHEWPQQRKENQWQPYAKNLQHVVALAREEAQIRAEAQGCSAYDALLEQYEPGMTHNQLDLLFDDLKVWLPSLLQQVIEKQAQQPPTQLQGVFPTAAQYQLGQQVMQLLGFDFSAGRLDISAHPFCGGVPEDVRITTRYREDNFIPALMGVIHETGHARYEQGLPRQWLGQPAAQARSTAIHESQSLFFEMQLARGEAFVSLIHPLVLAAFGHHQSLEPQHFLSLMHRVKADFIRVDADEVSYPLHIILRYEIERDLIEGRCEVQDIPELWQLKMQEYLQIDTRGNFRDGCMQDVHWGAGLFGYFPTYTLGAMYAAQLFQAALRTLPELDSMIRQGELHNLFNWLKNHIWEKASFHDTDTLIQTATGETLNPIHFRHHLQSRYL